MATLIVRNVDEDVRARLAQRAAKNGRSTEAEVRSILKEATREPSWFSEWFVSMPSFAGAELELPKRSAPREVIFELPERSAPRETVLVGEED
ncbi:MAG: plasmid stabilization protein [Coriobacteriia bacterium]|nr:plasmid stabilization protein [Coriobacteriia bacterium]